MTYLPVLFGNHNWGGVIVQNKINGKVLPDMNIDAWTSAITDIAEHPQKRDIPGKLAKERAQEFTWQKIAEQRAMLLKIYGKITSDDDFSNRAGLGKRKKSYRML